MPTEKRIFLRMNSDFSPLRIPPDEVREMLNCSVEPTHVYNTPGTQEIPSPLYTSTQSYTAVCEEGSTGDEVVRTATASTYSSQAEADALAQKKAMALALMDLVCVPVFVFEPFDYIVLRYEWTEDAGRDLDTFTGFINTGTPHDNDWVGYGQGEAKVPGGAPAPYLTWGNDNTGSGVESIVVDFKKLSQDYANLPEIVRVKMNALWWGTRGNGVVNVRLSTYLGGTMSYDATTKNYINTGGTAVNEQVLTKDVTHANHDKLIANSTPVAVLNWNKNTGRATLTTDGEITNPSTNSTFPYDLPQGFG